MLCRLSWSANYHNCLKSGAPFILKTFVEYSTNHQSEKRNPFFKHKIKKSSSIIFHCMQSFCNSSIMIWIDIKKNMFCHHEFWKNWNVYSNFGEKLYVDSLYDEIIMINYQKPCEFHILEMWCSNLFQLTE